MSIKTLAKLNTAPHVIDVSSFAGPGNSTIFQAHTDAGTAWIKKIARNCDVDFTQPPGRYVAVNRDGEELGFAIAVERCHRDWIDSDARHAGLVIGVPF